MPTWENRNSPRRELGDSLFAPPLWPKFGISGRMLEQAEAAAARLASVPGAEFKAVPLPSMKEPGP